MPEKDKAGKGSSSKDSPKDKEEALTKKATQVCFFCWASGCRPCCCSG
jgi:stalled ribosome alternative rescue factor ArfA